MDYRKVVSNIFWAIGLISIMVAIDQILLFNFGTTSLHVSQNQGVSPFKAHKKLGFVLNPKGYVNFIKGHLGGEHGDPYDYQFNDKGFRTKNHTHLIGKKRVNVFGDSFTFGVYLGEKDTFISILNESSKKCIFQNYGVPGYDSFQMLKLREELNSESFFDLFIMITDDLFRSTTPINFVRAPRGHSVEYFTKNFNFNIFPSMLLIPYNLVANSFFFQTLFISLNKYFWANVELEALWASYMKKVMSKPENQLIVIPTTLNLVKRKGVDLIKIDNIFLPFTIPFKDKVARNEFRSLFFKRDAHPNKTGARWIANSIIELVGEKCF